MNAGPPFPWYLPWLALGALLVTAIHEGGHLAAAWLTGQRDLAMSVGEYGRVIERRLGNVRLRLSAVSAPWRAAGSVRFEAAQMMARAMLLIALAGPAASFAGATATALLASSVESRALSEFFVMATVLGLGTGVFNLVPLTLTEGTRRRPGSRIQTDGRHALSALAVLRELRA